METTKEFTNVINDTAISKKKMRKSNNKNLIIFLVSVLSLMLVSSLGVVLYLVYGKRHVSTITVSPFNWAMPYKWGMDGFGTYPVDTLSITLKDMSQEEELHPGAPQINPETTINWNFVIHQLIPYFEKSEEHNLSVKSYLTLLLKSREQLKKLPNINKVPKDAMVVGDLHGQFRDLVYIIKHFFLPQMGSGMALVFNGDFVDRGTQSMATFCTLISLKLALPQQIFLNRGNHETLSLNKEYGFYKELKMRFGKEPHGNIKSVALFEASNAIMNYLPVASVIEHKVYVAHGGIYDNLDLKFIDKLNRTDMKQFEQHVSGILWNDPDNDPNSTGMHPNSRGGDTLIYASDVTKRFLKRHNLTLILRSHQEGQKDNGYARHHNDHVMTVFSAPNYACSRRNLGSVAEVHVIQDGSVRVSMRQFKAHHCLIDESGNPLVPHKAPKDPKLVLTVYPLDYDHPGNKIESKSAAKEKTDSTTTGGRVLG